jgi:hypothetical protein
VDTSGNITATRYNFGVGVGGSLSNITYDSTNHINVYWAPQSGATALGHAFVTWNGSAQVNAFSVGGQFAGTLAWVDNSGNYNTGGQLNFGASVGGTQSFLRVIAGGHTQLSSVQSGTAAGHIFQTWSGTGGINAFSIGGQFGSAPAWVDNSGNFNGASFMGKLQTIRNGTAQANTIFTGTTTPSSPAVGDMWWNQ